MSQVVITSDKGLSDLEKQEIAKLWSQLNRSVEDLPPFVIGYKR